MRQLVSEIDVTAYMCELTLADTAATVRFDWTDPSRRREIYAAYRLSPGAMARLRTIEQGMPWMHASGDAPPPYRLFPDWNHGEE
jgi:hypothetical protein